MIKLHIDAARNAHSEESRRWELASVVDHFEALDEWLSKGGFPPDEWSRYK